MKKKTLFSRKLIESTAAIPYSKRNLLIALATTIDLYYNRTQSFLIHLYHSLVYAAECNSPSFVRDYRMEKVLMDPHSEKRRIKKDRNAIVIE